jgi:hypothetical protein
LVIAMDAAALIARSLQVIDLCDAFLAHPLDESPRRALVDALVRTDPQFGNAADSSAARIEVLRRQGSIEATIARERLEDRSGRTSRSSTVFAVRQLRLTAAELLEALQLEH